jgi:hypothetical protein
MALMQTLTDNFSTKDLTKWSWLTNATTSGGQATFVATGAFDAEISSTSAFDLTGSYFLVELPAVSAGETYILLWFTDAGTNSIGFSIQGNIAAIQRVSGAQTNLIAPPYNPVDHRWVKVSESGGTTTWSISSNGVDWVTLATAANPIAVTSLKALVGSGGAGGGTAAADNVNLPPSSVPTTEETRNSSALSALYIP